MQIEKLIQGVFLTCSHYQSVKYICSQSITCRAGVATKILVSTGNNRNAGRYTPIAKHSSVF